MKYLLAIETSGRFGSVALLSNELPEENSFYTDLPRDAGSAKSLAFSIANLLKDSRIEFDQIGCIALLSGPGSFTGLRVGVSTAKALAYAWGIPIVGIDTMDAIHQQSQTVTDLRDATLVRHAILDAYREQLFVQTRGLEIEAPTRVIDVTAFLHDCQQIQAKHRQVLIGPGCDRVLRFLKSEWKERSTIDEGRWCRLDAPFSNEIPMFHGPELEPHALSVATMGWQMWKAGNVSDPFSIVPQYFRGSAAEEKIGKV